MNGQEGGLFGMPAEVVTPVSVELRERTRSWERCLVRTVKPSNALIAGADAVCMLARAVFSEARYLGCWLRVVREGN